MAHNQQGFTLLEMTIVLAVIAVLAALLTPFVSNYVDQARTTKAQSDAQAIGQSITNFEKDLGRYPMFTSGSGLLPDSSANVVTLRGPGNLPTESSATAWTRSTPTDSDCTSGCQFDFIASQLLTNAPAYATTTSLAKPFKWKGPYLDPQADPWGNTYLVNIINCKTSSADACFVLSAGPNGKVETPFNNPETSSVSPSGDDIIYRIR